MNTVPGLQPEIRAQLLANNVERQELRARQREIQTRLEELDQQDNVILIKAMRTEREVQEPTPNFPAYKGKPLLLLLELWKAPRHMLSYHDIREDVMCKEEASIDAVMSFVKRARNEMKSKKDFHYEIKSIQGWGYQLLHRESCQNPVEASKTQRE